MIDKKKINKLFDEMGYGYYCEPSSLKRARDKFKPAGLNCSDIDYVDEELEKYKKCFFKSYILRPMTDEERKWFEKQPKLDLNAPENEHILKFIKELEERGWFD